MKQKARHACGNWLWSQRLRRQLEGDSELTCLRVTGMERPSLDASVSANHSILHTLLVSLREKEQRENRMCILGFL
jgi:hypothetical protein